MDSLHLVTSLDGIHLSEERFRKYEHHLKAFVDAYPSPLIIRPKGLALQTFLTQIRSACNAHILKRFESSVDPDALATARRASLFVVQGDTIVCGPKSAIAQVARAEAESTGLDAPNVFLAEVQDPDFDTLCAFAFLYARGFLNQPTKFTGAMPAERPAFPGYALEQKGPLEWVMM